MRRAEIGLFGLQEKYIYRLQNYLNEKRLLPASVSGFTDVKKLSEYRKRHEMKFLLAEEEAWQEEIAKGDEDDWEGLTVFLLSAKREKGKIFLYQSGEGIAKEVLVLTGLEADCLVTGGRRGELIGIYSPVGRALKTSFTLCLGQILSRKYKVLYLNFESYSGFGAFMKKEHNSDMADLLFYLRNIREQFKEQVKETRQNMNGMDFIPPALSFMDISEITPPEWEEFFEELFALEEYDYILLDLSDHLQGLFETLKKCSRVYTMTKNDRVAQAKIAQYEKLLSELRAEEILDKTKKCNLPVCKNLPVSVEDFIYSSLGDVVRQVAREDFNC